MSNVLFRGAPVQIDADLTVKALTTTSVSTGAVAATSVVNTGDNSCVAHTQTGKLTLPSTTVLSGTAPTIPATSVVVIYNGVNSASVLPAVASSAGRILFLKNINGTGTATITANASETIDGGAGTLTLTPAKGAILYAITGGWAKLADV